MAKATFIIFLGLILCLDYFAQQKPFGYKISGSEDVISNTFIIKEGFKLDSVVADKRTYKFDYYGNGRLKSDYKFMLDTLSIIIDGHRKTIRVPRYQDYFYNERGDVDSVGYHLWYDSTYYYRGGYRINYVYDNEGRILIRKLPNGIYENTYDSKGNLILEVRTVDVIQEKIYREYDSKNRLTLKKLVQHPSFYEQSVFEYDSTGNIYCTEQLVQHNEINEIIEIRNGWHYFFRFDESGKLVYQTVTSTFNPDSTWGQGKEELMKYDENGNLIRVGNHNVFRFSYDADGNPDTLMFRSVNVGYLTDRVRFSDSYGNKIELGGNFYICHCYCSKLITSVEDNEMKNDMNYRLLQNYPNPFNPVTTINYYTPREEKVVLKIFDCLGREIKTLVNEYQSAGDHSVKFNASDLSSGIYFYRIQINNFMETKKLILLK